MVWSLKAGSLGSCLELQESVWWERVVWVHVEQHGGADGRGYRVLW